MKFFTAASIFVALLISAVVCVPFMQIAKDQPDLFALQVRLTTNHGGHVQVYYDTGAGFAETQSAVLPLQPSPRPVTYELTLPPATFRQLRFDPIDSDGTVTLQSMRVVTRDGRVIRDLPLSSLVPIHDIASVRAADSGVEIVPTHATIDPQLLVPLDPSLTLELHWDSSLRTDLRRFAIVLLTLLAGFFALDRLPGVRRWFSGVAQSAAAHPGRALVVVAALGVLASSYPVVFLGKSYVSPNMGTVLLYEDMPTLPGYTDSHDGQIMGSDIGAIMWQHVPLSMVEARALRHGEVPVWNRYNSAGTPLLGQGQSMFGDPLHFLVIAANGAAWAWDLKYLIAKWLFALGLGLLVWRLAEASSPLNGPPGGRALPALMVALPGTTAAALLVAAAAPFVGFFIYRFNHPAFFSLCYAPWPLYCWVRAVQARGLRATAGWAAGLMLANLALMNSGTAKEAYMLLLTMNLAGLCVLLTAGGFEVAAVVPTATSGMPIEDDRRRPSPWRTRALKLGILSWGGVLFGLITAPVWGTFLHELHNSYTSYNSAAAYQIQPTLLIGLFDEIFYRPLMPDNQTFSPALNFLLLLGFLYFVATLRTHFANRAVITIAAVSLLPLSLAFGFVPPDWIVRVPFLANVVHIDNTFSCALVVLWAVLAGIGFAHAARRLRTPEGRGDLVVAGLLFFALVFGWIAFRQAVHRPVYGPVVTVTKLGHPVPVDPFIWGYLASLVIASVVFALAARRALARGRWTPALGLLAAFCAVVLCWRNGLQAWSVGFERFVLRPTTRVNFHAKSEAVQFVQAGVKTEPGRAYGIRGNFFPGWNDAYALETIHGPDALMSPFYHELVGAMGGIHQIWDWREYLEPRDVAEARPFLDTLNVRYYLDLHSDQGLMGKTLKLDKLADLDVYESRTAWPRAFFTDRVFVYDKMDDYLRQIRAGDGRPFAAVQRPDLARNDTLASLWGDWKTRTVVPAAHYRLTENTTSFDVHATGPGAVVLLEAWWPGDFRAFINGAKVPPLRLNHAFEGVAIKGAGDYHIEFRCVPKGWYRNLALFGTGIVLLIASGVLVMRVREDDDADGEPSLREGIAAGRA